MASSKNIGRRGDGVRSLGKRKDGSVWWEARLYWKDERTGMEREKRARFAATSKALAMVERERLLAEAKEGGAPPTREKFRVVSAKHVEGIRTRATRLSAESHVRTLDAKFGDWFVDKITTRDMQDFLDSLTIASVNNIRSTLVNVFRMAVRMRLLETNPAKLTEPRRGTTYAEEDPDEDEEGPARALTPEQVAAYFDDLEANEPELYPLIYVQFMLGCRFAEVSALQRKDVDLTTGIVKIRRGQYLGTKGRTKGRRARKAALPAEARAMLTAHLDRMAVERWPGWEELVFPRPVTGRIRVYDFWSASTVDNKIRASFKRLGFEIKGTSHSARHTWVTMAESVEPSDALRRAMAGHRSQKMHDAYTHHSEERVADLSERVGKHLTGKRTGSKTSDVD